MIKLLNMYCNLFNWENGENTCLEFTISIILISALIIYQVFCKIKGRKSIFF